MTFGKRLQELRNEKGLGLGDLANKFNKSDSTFSAYENGRRSPNIELVRELADYFNVSIDYLLGKSNIKNNPNELIKEALENDPELYEFWNTLSQREELQLLFKQTRDLSPAAIKSVVAFIQAVEKEHGEES